MYPAHTDHRKCTSERSDSFNYHIVCNWDEMRKSLGSWRVDEWRDQRLVR